MTREDRLAGTGDVFAAVYEREHAPTVRLAWLLTGDQQVAEEIAHDAWVNTYRRVQLHPIDDLVPYVRRAVVNGARDAGRRGVLERGYLWAAGRERSVVADEPAAIGERLALTACLQRLPQRMRTAIVLRFYLDLSIRETAVAMGVAEGTVKSSVSKGLTQLRTMWGEDGNV